MREGALDAELLVIDAIARAWRNRGSSARAPRIPEPLIPGGRSATTLAPGSEASASETSRRGYPLARLRLASGHTIYPNGVVATYTPDNLNRLHSIEHRRSNGDLIAGFTYAVDNTGNRTTVDEAGEIGARHVDWGYDDEYKLTSETMNAPTATAIAFQYDNVGGRLKRFDDALQTQDLTYDPNDRILTLNGDSFLYDANGNTLTDGDNTYAWDIEDRMLSAVGSGHTIGNDYGGDGTKLIAVTDGVAKQYAIDANTIYSRVLEERTLGGALIAGYTYADAMLRQTTGPTYYHGDVIGSTRALTNSAQATTDAYTYEGFGATLGASGVTPNRFLFVGEESESPDIYNLRARHYRPTLGRMLSPDPLQGATGDPLLGHPYLYAGGRPLVLADPSGLFADVVVVAAFFGGPGGTASPTAAATTPAWAHTKVKWTAADETAFRAWISSNIVSYSQAHYDCADLAITLLIDYASVNGLPVKLKSSGGTFDSRTFGKTADSFKAIARRKINTEMLHNYNTIQKGLLPGDLAKAQMGDILIKPTTPFHTRIFLYPMNRGNGTWVRYAEGNLINGENEEVKIDYHSLARAARTPAIDFWDIYSW